MMMTTICRLNGEIMRNNSSLSKQVVGGSQAVITSFSRNVSKCRIMTSEAEFFKV